MTMTAVDIAQTAALGFLNLGIITSQILFLVSFVIGLACFCTLIGVKIRNCYAEQRYRVTPVPDEGKLNVCLNILN